MRKRFGLYIGGVSLLLAAIAYAPSAAAFTPAIYLSLVAAAGAVVGLCFGAVRVTTLTFAIVFLTFLGSPLASQVFEGFRAPRYFLLSSAVGLVLFGGLLFWDFKRSHQSRMRRPVSGDGDE
jgi:hypothetical protein